MVDLRLSNADVRWMRSFFPSLIYDAESCRVTGELSFCACYDLSDRKVKIEGLSRDTVLRNSLYMICDVFDVEMRLNELSVGSDSWPAVYEVGGRWQSIVAKYGLSPIDLHMNSKGQCCLGIR